MIDTVSIHMMYSFESKRIESWPKWIESEREFGESFQP